MIPTPPFPFYVVFEWPLLIAHKSLPLFSYLLNLANILHYMYTSYHQISEQTNLQRQQQPSMGIAARAHLC